MLRHLFAAGIALTCTNISIAQVKVGDNPNTIDINSVLELESTSKGLLFPRLTTAQMNAMVSPPNGLMIYNTTEAAFYVRSAGVWSPLSTGGTGWTTTGNSGINATNFLGTLNNASFRLRTNNVQRFITDSSGKTSYGTDTTDALLRLYGEGRSFPFGANQFNVTLYSRPTGVNTAGTNIVYGILSHAKSTTTGTYNAIAGRMLQADTSLANLTAALAHTNYTATFGASGLNTALLGIVNARENQLNDNTIYAASTLNVAGTATANALQDSNTYLIYTPAATATRKSYHAGRLGIGTQYPTARLHVYGTGNLFPFGASQFNVAMYARPTGFNAASTEIVYGMLSHAKSTTTGTYNAVAGRMLQTDTSLANLTAALAHTNYTATFGASGLNTAVLGIVNARENQLDDNTIYAASTLNIAGTATANALQDSNTYLIYTPAGTASRKSYHAGRFGVGVQNPSARLQVYGTGNLFPFGASQFNVAFYSRPTGVNAAGTEIVYGVLSHAKSTTTGTYNALAGRMLQADTSLANLTGAIAHTNYTATFGANGLNTAVLGIVNARENQLNDNTIYAATTLNVAGTATTSALQDSNTYLIYTPAATASRKSYHAGRLGVGTMYPNARLQVYGTGTPFPFGASIFNVSLYSRPTGTNAASNEIIYGVLSHTQTTTTGTYNALAGRILRADTSLANLTGAIGHTNYTAGNGFNTALLGIVNARENQLNDNTVYSGLRLTDATTGLTAAQMANTYTIFAPTNVKSYFEGSLGIGTSTPATKVHLNGGIAYAPVTSATAAVTVGDRSFIVLNNLTGAVTLSNGLTAGQVLVLKVTGTSVSFSNGTNLRLKTGAFAADDADVLSLIWDGSAWIETNRSENM